MSPDEQFPALNSDDEQARRLCALAISFSNAKTPISSAKIHEVHYPELNDDSFRRKFLRDREKLIECGLVILQTGTDGRDALWQADAASFADSSFLSEDDALMLDVLCAQLVTDPSFAYRDELRLALAKIDHAFGSLTAVRIAPTHQDSGSLRDMLACMTTRHLAKVTYLDARGRQTVRTVAPFGQFGLRKYVYFVCAQVIDGKVDEHSLRTLRTDRIQKVQRMSATFAVPEDFDVDDHIMLPFQLGKTSFEAVLQAGADTDADMLASLLNHATSEDDGSLRVSVSDVLAAARWCIAAGIRPISPEALCDTWSAVLEEAALAEPSAAAEGSPTVATTQQAKGRRGRKGAASELRELVALVGSLRHEGATLTPEAVAARLGISQERALLLLNLILTACTGTDCQLPLTLADGDGIVLSRSQGVSGRPIRLTQAEATALLAALDEAGFAANDPLRADVFEAFGPQGLDEQQALGRVEAALTRSQNETLEACSRAISAQKALQFRYRSANQSGPTERHVAPQSVRRSDDLWYLDAYDFDRRALRTFRIDRMQDVRVRALPESLTRVASEQPTERMVEVTFLDQSLLDLFEWHRLETLSRSGDAIITRLPYFGGMWLPRHLTACGSQATTADDELVSLVHQVARQATSFRD